MFSLMHSSSVYGVEGKGIAVEVDISSGLPQVSVVGLPDPAVRESVERVRAAIKNCGFTFPLDRITVNLAPADLRKEGTAFDLAIAAGVLTASGQLPAELFHGMLLIGELSLDGSIRPVPGVLSMMEQAKLSGMSKVLLPTRNAPEAAWISGMKLYALEHLAQLKSAALGAAFDWSEIEYAGISGETDEHSGANHEGDHAEALGDYRDVLGQQQAKRAMLISASGKHNVLLAGPPGSGKTMLIRRLPTILPPLTEEEALEVTKIYSIAGKLMSANGLMRTAPFRSPHHTISSGGLIGGGSIPKPGEVTLAHHGVLFLDELPEFSRAVLEVLRQPLEDRFVTIARSKAVFRFPAGLMLAASMNPCPCGYRGHDYGDRFCTCSPSSIARYQSRMSGPLLDRIDLQLEVPRPTISEYTTSGMSSAEMRNLVLEARERQAARSRRQGMSGDELLAGASLRRAIQLKSEAVKLMEDAFDALGISMRAYDRILKLARTIADVEQSDSVEAVHVAEAIQYRRSGG
ncbi:YifB family Mg chelatase-like AAA ATPase [Paenibacillus sp. GCM10023252]|uniref:YifB family Mg chelatase-like AAA ATPase n=1 Tax=Paenibacillus sp. GCM10023252 TaxID=3252649 RepID=UPI0036219081